MYVFVYYTSARLEDESGPSIRQGKAFKPSCDRTPSACTPLSARHISLTLSITITHYTLVGTYNLIPTLAINRQYYTRDQPRIDNRAEESYSMWNHIWFHYSYANLSLVQSADSDYTVDSGFP